MDNYFSRYVHLALSGDNSAFETLYNLTKDSAFFVTLKITKNEQDAINILQESYIRAFENLNMLSNPEAFDVWFYRIVADSNMDYIKEKNPAAFDDTMESYEWNDEENYDILPQETVDDKDIKRIVNEIVDNLPDEQRLLVLIHYYQQISVDSISKILDISENTVKYILSAARENIKSKINKLEADGVLLRHITLSAVPSVLLDSSKMQFLFHPAPPIGNIIDLPEDGFTPQNDIALQQTFEQQTTDNNTISYDEPVQQEVQPQYNEYSDNTQENLYQENQTSYKADNQFADIYQEQPQEQPQEQSYSESTFESESESEPTFEQEFETESESNPTFEQEFETESESEPTFEQEPEPQKTIQKPKNEPYKRVLESNFSVENAPKPKKQKDSSSSLVKKMSGFFKSTAGIVTISSLVLVAVIGTAIFLISSAAQNSSIAKDMEGMVKNPSNDTIVSEEESSHEPTPEEIRAAKYEADKENYEHKKLSDGTLCITKYNGSMEDVIIPEMIGDKKVTAIEKNAFQGCTRIKSITISKYITSINLNVSSADVHPFYDCVYIRNFYVDSENTKYTSVDGILFSKDQTELLCYPAAKTDIKYTVPSNVKKIGISAFMRNSMIEEIVVPNGITKIENETFAHCESLKNITLPSGLKVIGGRTFEGCKAIKSINIPETVIEIGQYAFKDCTSINNITVPANVEKMGVSCFQDCTFLYNCTIRNSELEFADMSKIQNGGIFGGTNVTIRASKGSTAIAYAKKCKLEFEEI